MNCYGVQDLLMKLGIKKLVFKEDNYNTLEFDNHILVDSHNTFYYCKDQEDYEKNFQKYYWDISYFNYFYDSDVDAVVFEYTVWGTDTVLCESQNRLFAIVPVSFLNAYKIELDFRKENVNESYNCN